ncbi:PEP-CTERM sorting domain-containing protein [Accumulibacter sp.]|jgi:hypothetical protein|uniref:PEP-CTERM sorting domain-containing protein n=1 Tax=Accumulibacter sp. TaxID=2053492 RepID=UPI0026256F20|nr:PEP-CTERM sorting domain-containing protein [Accumulibacter sp.]
MQHAIRLFVALLFVALLFHLLATSAIAAPVNLVIGATAPQVPTAGTIIVDLIDGDGVSGSHVFLEKLSVRPTSIDGAVSEPSPGRFLIADEQVLSSLYFDLADVYAGFALTIDSYLADPDIFGFPDSLVLSAIDAAGMPLFLTTDPSGANAWMVLSAYGLEVYAPAGLALSVTSGSAAVPEPATGLLMLLAVVALMLARSALGRRWATVAMLALGVSLPAHAYVTDATAQVSITRSPLVYNRATQTYDGLVSVRNIGTQTLWAPAYLVVSGVPSGVLVTNWTGANTDGQPMLALPVTATGLAPGQTTGNFPVKFRNSQQIKFTPSFAVWSNDSDTAVAEPGLVLPPITDRPASPEKIMTLASGVQVVMSDLLVVTEDSLTLEQATAIFQRHGAKIVGRVPEAFYYQLDVAAATTEESLERVRSNIAGESGVVAVSALVHKYSL